MFPMGFPNGIEGRQDVEVQRGKQHDDGIDKEGVRQRD
jgi:hypothetical protein